jgi:hypothetical protein
MDGEKLSMNTSDSIIAGIPYTITFRCKMPVVSNQFL